MTTSFPGSSLLWRKEVINFKLSSRHENSIEYWNYYWNLTYIWPTFVCAFAHFVVAKAFWNSRLYISSTSQSSLLQHMSTFSYPEPFLRAVRRGALAKSISNWHLIGYNEGYCSNNVYIFYHVFMVSGFGFGQSPSSHRA